VSDFFSDNRAIAGYTCHVIYTIFHRCFRHFPQHTYSPLTYKSHQDLPQPRPAAPGPVAAAAAVAAGTPDMPDTHPEAAAVPVAAVAAAHCDRAWVVVASSTRWSDSRETCAASAGLDRVFAAAAAAAAAVAAERKGHIRRQRTAR
jgi:hypothetical protein